MENMFCYQCEQTAKGVGCTVSGVCGKPPPVAAAQDELTCEMIALARATTPDRTSHIDLIVDGLFTTITNTSFYQEAIDSLTARMAQEREALGGKPVMRAQELFHGDTDLVALRSTLLFGLRGMAAYAHHARVLGKRDSNVDNWFLKGMAALSQEHSVESWLDLIMEFGHINFKCMALLDAANTGAYGNPVPTAVPMTIEPGPFIVVSGHDLRDLKMLLEQTDGTGVNVYTHSEMLPAHGYPKLKAHPQLKGNYGTSWQNQQREFASMPAPVLFTTNCLMPVGPSYSDRVFTTAIVGYPEMVHIDADEHGYKDFSPLIAKAKELGGYHEPHIMHGVNQGITVTTGFGRQTVLDHAPTIIEAVKAGQISHFFLVGGCDGSQPGRNYYTEFVKETPSDSVILTLACGKYRINDMDLGSIGPFPRILDMGQCNDAYGAVQVAMALANAFDCEVNDLPLTLVLSWFEQKAVCILLTLLSLGIKNIYIGPTLPAFFSPNVLHILVEKFHLHPITTPKEDLANIMVKK